MWLAMYKIFSCFFIMLIYLPVSSDACAFYLNLCYCIFVCLMLYFFMCHYMCLRLLLRKLVSFYCMIVIELVSFFKCTEFGLLVDLFIFVCFFFLSGFQCFMTLYVCVHLCICVCVYACMDVYMCI